MAATTKVYYQTDKEINNKEESRLSTKKCKSTDAQSQSTVYLLIVGINTPIKFKKSIQSGVGCRRQTIALQDRSDCLTEQKTELAQSLRS